ncbi:hypothetical protein [Candidatus Alkanophaga liquidiphilum]
MPTCQCNCEYEIKVFYYYFVHVVTAATHAASVPVVFRPKGQCRRGTLVCRTFEEREERR